jgi:hypothetical protein
VLDPDGDVNLLHRGIRGFDRRKTETLLNPVEYSSSTDALFKACFTQVESGILYVDYRFWTQFTTTWDDNVAIHRNVRSQARSQSGPEKRWDSTRRDSNFTFHRAVKDVKNPDFVYPEIIQVTVTVELGSPDLQGRWRKRSTVALYPPEPRGMPGNLAMRWRRSKWIEYKEKSTNDLSGCAGASGPKPGATDRHGGALRRTFTTE